MKVIFIKDLKGQGKSGEIKIVKDGYSSFLIKNGYAVPATETGIKRLDDQNKKNKEKELLLISDCKKIKAKLEKIKLTFKVKTGSSDRVFGSVSTKMISSELKDKGFDIDKKNIKVDTPIASLGTHIVQIELHKEVIADLKIEVLKEK